MGKKLSDLTTKRVIILVLAMMFSVPIFSIYTYKDENNSFKFGLELMDQYSADPRGQEFQISFDTYRDKHSELRTPLISLFVEIEQFEQSLDSDTSPAELRAIETDVTTIRNGDYVAIFDLRKNTRLTAGLSIGRTLFV